MGQNFPWHGALAALWLTSAALLTHAAEGTETSPVLEQVRVIGQRDAQYAVPGSAHYIDYEDIRGMSYDDINRILNEIPGVYAREEDGYGLFPNLSLRGVDTSRSAKVTLMEDGILAAPAPYAAPSAYYSPTTGRMHGLEVLKGTSQTKYGPHITGGVINYLSTPVPEAQQALLRTQVGSDGDTRVHAFYGNTIDAGAGELGFLLEIYQRSVEGFKTIDTAPDFDGRETGFDNVEPMIKVAWEPDSRIYQRFEFKHGRTDKQANETYLGLAPVDFAADPYRRYSASRFDHIDTEHKRTYLRHFMSPTANLDVVSTIYRNEFARNWYKLNDIRAGVGGLRENLNLSAALAGAAGGDGLACLRGELACGLRVRANNREYDGKGIQSDATLRFGIGDTKHKLAFGIRVHQDIEDRFQWQDVYGQDDTGRILGVVRGTPGSQDNREAETRAVAVYLQDTITVGDWLLQPGIRYERLDMQHRDYRNGVRIRDAKLGMLSGGLAATYQVSDNLQLLGGIHRGFSPPGPGAAAGGLKEETSLGMELGLRYTDNPGFLRAELVWFSTGFKDLIVVSNLGGTGTGNDENFGEVDASGIEFSSALDLGRMNNWSVGNTWFLTYTYTNAEQKNDAQSTDAESIFSYGAPGNELPYIPSYRVTLGTTLDLNVMTFELMVSSVDKNFTSANNVSIPVNGAGNPDARFGQTDGHTLVDLSVSARPWKNVELFGGFHNLFDENYIVSLQPHGARPGLPRSWYAGISLELE